MMKGRKEREGFKLHRYSVLYMALQQQSQHETETRETEGKREEMIRRVDWPDGRVVQVEKGTNEKKKKASKGERERDKSINEKKA